MSTLRLQEYNPSDGIMMGDVVELSLGARDREDCGTFIGLVTSIDDLGKCFSIAVTPGSQTRPEMPNHAAGWKIEHVLSWKPSPAREHINPQRQKLVESQKSGIERALDSLFGFPI